MSAQKGRGSIEMDRKNRDSYLCRKCVALDAMLGAVRIIRAVVKKDLLYLVAVGQRSGGNVDGKRMLGPRFWTEDERLARVVQDSRDLYNTQYIHHHSINGLCHQTNKRGGGNNNKCPFSFLFDFFFLLLLTRLHK